MSKIFNFLDIYAFSLSSSIMHIRTIEEFTTLSELYDFGLILVDFNIENYKLCFDLASKVKQMQEEDILTTATIIALSSIPVSPSLLAKNDFDLIISNKTEDLHSLREEYLSEFQLSQKYISNYKFKAKSE